MIKFFKHIRQRLVTENKFSKPASPARPNGLSGRAGRYLLYAIGEIILVVIGILIALQINNWNENKKDKRQEFKQLKALKVEFDKNIITLDSITNHHRENEDATRKLMNASAKNYTLKTLDSLFFKAMYNYNFDPSKGIYNSLISSGQIELLSNEILKFKIAEIQDIVADYIDDENAVRYYSNKVLMPFTVNQMPYNPLRLYQNRTFKEQKEHHKLFKEMINNRIFIEHLSMLSLRRIGVFKEGLKVRNEYQNIVETIHQEISRIDH